MGQIKVMRASIDGLFVLEPTVHGDSRGYFMEMYNQCGDAGLWINMVVI